MKSIDIFDYFEAQDVLLYDQDLIAGHYTDYLDTLPPFKREGLECSLGTIAPLCSGYEEALANYRAEHFTFLGHFNASPLFVENKDIEAARRIALEAPISPYIDLYHGGE